MRFKTSYKPSFWVGARSNDVRFRFMVRAAEKLACPCHVLRCARDVQYLADAYALFPAPGIVKKSINRAQTLLH